MRKPSAELTRYIGSPEWKRHHGYEELNVGMMVGLGSGVSGKILAKKNGLYKVACGGLGPLWYRADQLNNVF